VVVRNEDDVTDGAELETGVVEEVLRESALLLAPSPSQREGSFGIDNSPRRTTLG
jgi:hypothetical protein